MGGMGGQKGRAMARVLLANLAQETCSFVSSRHTLDDFRRYYLYAGQEIIERFRGGGMEIAGIIESAESSRFTISSSSS